MWSQHHRRCTKTTARTHRAFGTRGISPSHLASHPSILETVPPDCREMDVPIELDSIEGIKTLGLLWHPLLDQFLISKQTCAQRLREPKNFLVSKLIISSMVAAIFDPLGLISPVVVVY